MKVRIDTDICTGHGRCYALSPDVFETDDSGYGMVTATGDLDEAQLASAQRAADNCPEQAIIIE
jgi:ferredoxin